MTNSQNISFSYNLSQQRMARARKSLGAKVVNRIICFALYLLGVDRETIADGQKTPSGSVKSIIRAVFHGGLPAFEDRRRSTSMFLPPQGEKIPKVSVYVQAEEIIVDIGNSRQIKIPRKNSLQAKVILRKITFLPGGRQVAIVLNRVKRMWLVWLPSCLPVGRQANFKA